MASCACQADRDCNGSKRMSFALIFSVNFVMEENNQMIGIWTSDYRLSSRQREVSSDGLYIFPNWNARRDMQFGVDWRPGF